MTVFEKFRLPYREDSLFSCLAFTVFLVPLVFSLLTNENFETAKFSSFLILTGLGLLIFFQRIRKQTAILKWNRLFFYFLSAWLFFAVISTVLSSDVIYSLFGFYYRFTSGLLFYFCLAVFLFLLLAVLDRGRMEFLLKITVFCGLVVAVISCLQALGISYYAGLDSGGFLRGPSLLGNPNYSAMFLAAVLPLALVFLSLGQKFYQKIYYGLCIFFIILANVILASRGALLAMAISLAVGLALLLIYNLPKKISLALFLLIVGALIFGQVLLFVSRPQALTSIVQTVDLNTISRIEVWQVTLKGISAHPLLGSGPGTFALFYERHIQGGLSGAIGVFDDPHNLFLHMAETSGLPFVVSFLGLIVISCFYGLKQLAKEKDLLTLGCLVSLVAWVVGVSFNPVPIPMFLLLAVLLASLLFKDSQTKTVYFNKPARALIVVMGAVFIACGVLLIVSEYIFGFSKIYFLNQSYDKAYSLSSLAANINPTNQIYKVYKIGSEISLGKSPDLVTADILQFTRIHPLEARTHVEASNFYNLLYRSTGNKVFLQAAIAQMQTALAIDPYYGERYGQLALYYYQLGNLPAAKIAVIKSLSLKDDDFSSWVLLAKIYQQYNEKPQAILALEKAFHLQPNIPQLRYLLYLAKTSKDIRQVPIQIVIRPPNLD